MLEKKKVQLKKSINQLINLSTLLLTDTFFEEENKNKKVTRKKTKY